MAVNNQVILWSMELSRKYPYESHLATYIADHNRIFGSEYWDRFQTLEDLEHEYLSYRSYLRKKRKGMK